MRINKYLASATGLSRRSADEAVANGRVTVNGKTAEQGSQVTPTDVVALDGRSVHAPVAHTTIILHKPVGFVVSRSGQGSRTIYDILPPQYHRLNPIGRLDKDSSGLLLLTDDGNLAHELAHPSRQKTKIYEVTLDKPLQPLHHQMISDYGVMLEDGPSKFQITRLGLPAGHEAQAKPLGRRRHNSEFTSKSAPEGKALLVTMHEGRNRQIRRTFEALGYSVQTLHRTHFGPYMLGNLKAGNIYEF